MIYAERTRVTIPWFSGSLFQVWVRLAVDVAFSPIARTDLGWRLSQVVLLFHILLWIFLHTLHLTALPIPYSCLAITNYWVGSS